jgi:GNAT superfamily N-acetyltransferase
MPYRQATYSDVEPAAKILAAAFKNDGFMGIYLHPYLDKYPDSLEKRYIRSLRSQWARMSDEHKLLVAYQPTADAKGEERLTGVASWSRRRATPTPQTWTTTGWTTAMNYYNKLHEWFYPDRAADPERAKILDRAAPYSKHLWTGSRAEVWYLNVLGVDPAFEGKGIGRELVAWGFEQAKKDGVGTSCIAAQGRDRFYQACGFDVQCGIAGDEGPDEELRRELRSIGGGMVHFWDGGREPFGVKKYGED